MKRRMALALAALLAAALTGCSAQYTWETVEDFLPAQPVSVLAGAYRLDFAVPQDVQITEQTADGSLCVYEQMDGAYEITAQTMLSSTPDGAIRRLTGFAPEQLPIIKTKRFGLRAYQLVWYCLGEEGGSLCRAAVVCDGNLCYTLSFSVREERGAQYAETAQAVFESLSLNAATEL